ncbi:hypothetical protein [Acidobacterium sp. S8]|uniref:hypothetical protein n=1 Tax=Acidobacterium sp. S8 TaxID=1641854 RepID=UPI00131ED001|nr:hypothetical protein [Acidobacterium sp. S8]
MLIEDQPRNVWERLISAETCTYYFGDLAGSYTRQKQIVTFLSLFLSFSAVITVLLKVPAWIPALMSIVVTLAAAYTVAFNLDQKTRTMAELNHSWAEVASGYERIWENPDTAESGALYSQLEEKVRDLSMLAANEAPNDPKRMVKWKNRVLELRNVQQVQSTKISPSPQEQK